MTSDVRARPKIWRTILFISRTYRYPSTSGHGTPRMSGIRNSALLMGWGNPDQLALGNLNRGGVKLRSCAAQAVFAWPPEACPGLLLGMAELLGSCAAVRTVLDWRRGRRRPAMGGSCWNWGGCNPVNRGVSKEKRLLGQPQRSTGDYKSVTIGVAFN
jgi:hypothetical protein